MISVDATLTLTPDIIRFERLAGRFTDFVPVLGGRVDVLVRNLIRRQFQTLGRASGRGQWPKLTEAYEKRRQFPGRPTLRQTDELYNALTKRNDPNADVTLERDEYSRTVADGPVRAKFVGHQLGWEPSGLPVRQMIPDPLPNSFIDDVRRAVKSYVVDNAR